MPYKRSYNSKKKPVSKNVKSYVRKAIKQDKEVKLKSNQLVSRTLNATWQNFGVLSIQHLNGTDEGDGQAQRDGLALYQRAIRLKMTMDMPLDRAQGCRILIIERKSNFVSPGDLPSLTNGLTNPIDYAMRAKYNVLHDKVYNPVPARDDNGFVRRYVYRTINLNLKNKVLHYIGTTAADLLNGRILVYAAADNHPGGTGWITLNGTADFYFRER